MYIKDKILGKYIIHVTNNSYDVGEMKHNKKKDEHYFEADTFHTTIGRAVLKVAIHLSNDGYGSDEIVSLLEYKDKLDTIHQNIIDSLNINEYV